MNIFVLLDVNLNVMSERVFIELYDLFVMLWNMIMYCNFLFLFKFEEYYIMVK